MRTDKELDALLGLVLGKKPTPKRLAKWLEPIASQVRGGDSLPTEYLESKLNVAAAIQKAKDALAVRAPSQSPQFASLAAAADCLLGVLEPAQRDTCHDVARELNVPPWVIVCGAVARAADLRELHAGDFTSEMLNTPDAIKPEPAVTACMRCKLVIPNARRNQMYCCNRCGSDLDPHSTDCPAWKASGHPLAGEHEEPKPAQPVGPFAAGHCEKCGVELLEKSRRFCCSAHGSDREEHSETCFVLVPKPTEVAHEPATL